MRDQTIEERLRSTLRAEADELPFTVTVDELERRLLLRRRAAAGRRVGLIAAGVAVVVVGGAFLLATNPFRGTQIATTPQPTIGPSIAPSSQLPASVPPSVAPSAVASGEPRIDPALQDLNPTPGSHDPLRSEVPGDPSSTDTTLSGTSFDSVSDTAREAGIKLVCLGPDQLTLEWSQDGDSIPIANELIECDNTIATFRYDISARQPLIDDSLIIFSTPRTSYRILVEEFGATNVPTPIGVPPLATPGGQVLLQGSKVFAASTATTTDIGKIPARFAYRVAISCNSTKAATTSEAPTATWSIGKIGTADFVDQGAVACDGAPRGFRSAVGLASGDRHVFVAASADTVWRLVVTGAYGPPTFIPPALSMWTGSDTSDVTSGPAQCIGYDGNGDSCGLELTARDGSAVVTAARGGHASLRVDDGWTIEQASVHVADRAAIRKDPTSAESREFTVLDDGSGRLTGSGDRMSLSLAGLDRGEWILTVTIQCRKGGHTFGASYLLPVMIE